MEKDKPKGIAFETFDVMELLERFEKSSLSELKVRNGDIELVFKRGVPAGPVPPQAFAPVHLASQGTAVAAAPAVEAPQSPVTEPITSPIVGTFYRAPAPDAPPFVENGAKVKKGQTLCILEAMKLMNELEAEFDCEIIAILVENGKMAEFGTPLFEVRRT
jgi:acetyl-CoA carboxylase biotin carboxyl carrier protein